jgi:pilus assembly protein CpaB
MGMNVMNGRRILVLGGVIALAVGTAVTARNLTTGSPTPAARATPLDAETQAAALARGGLRAVTVPVPGESAVASLVFPGDRIDLVRTQDAGGAAPSQVVVRNLRVISTDRQSGDHGNEPGNATASSFSTITVEASPQAADRIAMAQALGSLSFTPAADPGEYQEIDDASAPVQ